MPTDRLAQRLVRCVIGLVMCGTGIALIIDGDVGLAPWDVLHQGISEHTGIPIGTVIVLVGAALLALWIPLHVRPGVGTFLNAILIGVVVDVTDPLVPDVEHPVVGTIVMLAGVLAFGVGTGLYIGSGLGPGPRDGLMTGLARRGLRIHVARTAIEVAVLVAGVLLGGSVGIGTATFAFGIGPLAQFFLPRFDMDGTYAPARTAVASPA